MLKWIFYSCNKKALRKGLHGGVRLCWHFPGQTLCPQQQSCSHPCPAQEGRDRVTVLLLLLQRAPALLRAHCQRSSQDGSALLHLHFRFSLFLPSSPSYISSYHIKSIISYQIYYIISNHSYHIIHHIIIILFPISYKNVRV